MTEKMMLFALNSNSQDEIIGLEDATITKSAGLTGRSELHQTGTLIGIDGERDALFATDAVTVGGGHVPDAPGDALEKLTPSCPPPGGDGEGFCALGYAAQF